MTDLTDEQMREIASTAHSKSAKIRALDRNGVTKSAIAAFLGIKYQFVYNVLARDVPKFETTPPASGRAASGGAVLQLRVEAEGRVTLPAEFIEAESLRQGDTLFCRRDAEGITIMSRAAAIKSLETLLKERLPDQAGLIEALLNNPAGTPPGKEGS